jgi:hypothetical protein
LFIGNFHKPKYQANNFFGRWGERVGTWEKNTVFLKFFFNFWFILIDNEKSDRETKKGKKERKGEKDKRMREEEKRSDEKRVYCICFVEYAVLSLHLLLIFCLTNFIYFFLTNTTKKQYSLIHLLQINKK